LKSEDFRALPAAAISARVAAGTLDPAEVVAASFARAKEVGAGRDELNLVLWSDEKMAQADAVSVKERMGPRGGGGSLAGVPMAVKDNIATLGLPTTCASRILAGYVSPFEATAITRLRMEGAIVVAKTNMDE